MRPTFPRSFRPPTARPLPTISNNLPTVHDLPVNQVHPANKHHVTYKRSYPSGPRLEQLRLKYPYMSAQTLADSICTHAGEMKGAVIFRQLREAMGKCGTSKFARPITGMQIKLNGVTHTELLRNTTINYRVGNINNGFREDKQTTQVHKAGVRTCQVRMCSIPTPF